MDTRRLTVNCSILFTELPLLRRPQAARDAGFDAVEFWWPFDAAVPSDADIAAFIAAVCDAGIRLTHLNFAAGDLSAGERGLLSHPDTSDAFRDSVEVAVGIGQRLGTVGFNALYGNRVDGLDPARQDAIATENLAFAARSAATIGADILIEPLSAIPDYPLRSAGDGLAVAHRVRGEHGVDNVLLLADLYHLAVNGEDLDRALTQHAERIGHVQLADAPGRGEPGTGTTDLERHLHTLHDAGYRGWLSLEYRRTQANPFGWLADFATEPR